jgi:peptidoglycan/LPS O-acetylase OafA/YrhL
VEEEGELVAKPAVMASLTGVRLVAACWVVAFHIYLYNGDELAHVHPAVDGVIGPIASQGDLGVDLFFLLSGFVLGHNYLDRLGARPSARQWLSFLWLRVARVWPLYMVAVLGGGLLLSLRHDWWGSQPNVPLSWGRFLAQLLMVQQWDAPNVPDTSWTGPAWSISAEWLAYVCFPVLALLVWRVRRHAGQRALVALAGAALLPTLVWTAAAHTQAAPFMWLGRLASEFSCGVLLSAAYSNASPRLKATARWLTPASIVAGIAWLYAVEVLDRAWLGPLVLAVFPVLVVALAHGDGRLHRMLASRPMVVGGGLSFALYLVHVPLLKLFRDALVHRAVPFSPRDQLYGELVVASLSLVVAYVLFRYVEEPARHRLRGLAPRIAELPEVSAPVERGAGTQAPRYSDGADPSYRPLHAALGPGPMAAVTSSWSSPPRSASHTALPTWAQGKDGGE